MPVSGIPHGTARCSWPIVAINVGPGGQPEDVFEDILEDVLERLVAPQMPEDSSTGNFQLGFGRTPLFLLGRYFSMIVIPGKSSLFLLWCGVGGDLCYNLVPICHRGVKCDFFTFCCFGAVHLHTLVEG